MSAGRERDPRETAGAGTRPSVSSVLFLCGMNAIRSPIAETLARQELSPQQAEANVTYLRSMLAQQNAWSEIKDEEKNTN